MSITPATRGVPSYSSIPTNHHYFFRYQHERTYFTVESTPLGSTAVAFCTGSTYTYQSSLRHYGPVQSRRRVSARRSETRNDYTAIHTHPIHSHPRPLPSVPPRPCPVPPLSLSSPLLPSQPPLQSGACTTPSPWCGTTLSSRLPRSVRTQGTWYGGKF